MLPILSRAIFSVSLRFLLNITLTEFYSGIDEGNLDGEQMLLLELFAKVPQNKRKVVLDLLQNLSGED